MSVETFVVNYYTSIDLPHSGREDRDRHDWALSQIGRLIVDKIGMDTIFTVELFEKSEINDDFFKIVTVGVKLARCDTHRWTVPILDEYYEKMEYRELSLTALGEIKVRIKRAWKKLWSKNASKR